MAAQGVTHAVSSAAAAIGPDIMLFIAGLPFGNVLVQPGLLRADRVSFPHLDLAKVLEQALLNSQ